MPVATSLIETIQANHVRFVIAVTGGGSRAIADLLAVPGASKVLLDAVVPYAATALDDFLGAAPESYCSEPTARAMAVAAFERARRLAPAGDDPASLAGVACTASLVSDRPKRGAHRIHVALQTDRLTRSWSVTLAKGRRGREQEEEVAGRLVLAAMSGVDVPNTTLLLAEDEPLEEKRTDAPPSWTALYRGEQSAVLAVGEAPASMESRRLVFPGAFHPRHQGHRRMAQYAAERTGLPVEHEISILNVDKPALDFAEMAQRAAQFEPGEKIWFTRTPTFAEKAQLFPGATFVVGADTIQRIADVRYYDGDATRRDAAIARLAEQGARLIVFGRLIHGHYQGLAELSLPPRLAELCEDVPETVFREDVSSTELRRAGEKFT